MSLKKPLFYCWNKIRFYALKGLRMYQHEYLQTASLPHHTNITVKQNKKDKCLVKR